MPSICIEKELSLIKDDAQNLDPEYNHSRAVSYITSAAADGAKLAVLPEFVLPPLTVVGKYQIYYSNVICFLTLLLYCRYHLCGWAPESPEFYAIALKNQPYLDAYCQLAKKLHINIVPGTIIETEKKETLSNKDSQEPKDHILYNTAYFISSSGDIVGKYRKKNIWHPERPHLTSSGNDPHEVLDTEVGKVGMLICWDLAFPEAFRELIANGAEIIIIPTFCICLLLFSIPFLTLRRLRGMDLLTVETHDRGQTRRQRRSP